MHLSTAIARLEASGADALLEDGFEGVGGGDVEHGVLSL
jgi:hypothetical protein